MSRFMLAGMTLDARERRWRRPSPRVVYMMFQMTFAIITPALIVRRLRRPDEVLGPAVGLHDAVVADRLLADRALGLGRRRLPRTARACSTSPAARSCTSTPASPAWSPASCSASGSAIGQEPMAPHNLVLSADRRLAALGRLVRLQRRLGGGRRRPRRHGDGRHPHRHRRRGARLDVRRVDRPRASRSVLGIVSGAVAGLVAITPASGFVDPDRRAGHRPRRRRHLLLRRHLAQARAAATTTRSTPSACTAIGGIIGALLTGVFAVSAVGGEAARA